MVTRSTDKQSMGEFCSDALIAELYSELRGLAAAKLRKLPAGQTLQATALVHEAFLRLASEPSARWQNRGPIAANERLDWRIL